MATVTQIINYVQLHSVGEILAAGLANNYTQAEIEFALRVKELMILEQAR